MTRQTLNKALPALAELAKLQLPYDKARQVQRWKRAAEENRADLLARWKSLSEQYRAADDGQGQLTFQTAEEKDQFAAAWTEYVSETADGAPLPTIDLSAQRDTIQVSATILEALDDIVIWEGET